MKTADGMRKRGWVVAIHNDYRQDGVMHTFWLDFWLSRTGWPESGGMVGKCEHFDLDKAWEEM